MGQRVHPKRRDDVRESFVEWRRFDWPAQFTQQQDEFAQDRLVRGIEPRRRAQGCLRLREPAGGHQGAGQPDVDLDALQAKRDGALVAAGGLARPAQGGENLGAEIMRAAAVGRQREAPVDGFQGLGGTAGLVEDARQQEAQTRAFGIGAHGLAAQLLGPRVVAVHVICDDVVLLNVGCHVAARLRSSR